MESKKKIYKRTYLQNRNRLTDLEKELLVMGGRMRGRDSRGVWDGRGHPAVFNAGNQQGRAGELRELCSIENKKLNFKSLIIYTLLNMTEAITGLLCSPGSCAQYSVMTYMEKEL